MIRFAVFSQISVFIAFHAYGIHSLFSQLLGKTNTGEFSAILNPTAFFSSPLPFYLLQFLLVLAVTTALFIGINAKFAVRFSSIAVIKSHIPNSKIAIILWSLISTTALFILNSAYFKHSSHLPEFFWMWPPIHLSTYLCWIALLCPIVFWAITSFKQPSTKIVLGLVITLLAFYEASKLHIAEPVTQNNEKPNIIIIGIDSLRADLFKSHMPFLTEQLKKSTIFENSYTELGRTFPAWNSILTGQYPSTHKAQLNLLPNDHLLPSDHYLPSMLKATGYKTILAYDETRFANFTEYYGFDQIITPRMGASDFLIGEISDYPLINLLSLSKYARILIPEIYGNRAIYKTYRSESFSQMLNDDIANINQPTFLAVHFCLPHWPYAFSTEIPPERNYPEPYYPVNLRAVDQQLEKLFSALEQKGFLNNSRVVFLSDHGESWKHESKRFKQASSEERFKLSYGHGSDLSSETGNRVLIAFQNFKGENLEGNRMKTASLADIAPTIVNEVKQTNLKSHHFDGMDLNQTALPESRLFPIETGTVLNLDEKNNLNVDSLITTMLDRYRLNNKGYVEIRKDKISTSLQAKQYGIRTKDHLFTKEADEFVLYQLNNHTAQVFKTISQASKETELATSWCHWHGANEQECLALTNIK